MNPFFTRPRKLLAIKLRPLGESALLSASIYALKEAFPDTELHVATTAPWAQLLIHHPGIARIWPVDRHTDKLSRVRAIARAALKLRSENFDGVINFHASPSSATLAFATGAPVRSIHFHSDKTRNRYSTVAIPDQGALKTMLERDFDAIRALGVSVQSSRYHPTVTLKPSEMDEGFRLLQTLGLQRPLLALGLGSSRPTKSWPAELFAELINDWKSQKNGSVLLIGESEQSEFVNQICSRLSDQANLATLKESDLRLLSAVFMQCSVFVGNDSGVRHVAAASGLPTVTLFGPEHPKEWTFYSAERHTQLFIEGLSCRRDGPPAGPEWCALQECLKEKHRCMKDIHPISVLEAALRVMK